MKRVFDLKPGEVIVENGVRFTTKKSKVANETVLPRLHGSQVLEYQGDRAIVKWPDERPRSCEEYRKAFSDLFCGGVDNTIKEALKEDED